MNLKVYTDGGAHNNPGPAAVGVVIKDEHEETLHQFGKKIGETTNNVAEYQAVIEALKYLVLHSKRYQLQKQRVDFFIDSKLVVSQLNGLFKIKESRLAEQVFRIKSLEQEIPADIFYHFIPREKNHAHQQVDEAFRA